MRPIPAMEWSQRLRPALDGRSGVLLGSYVWNRMFASIKMSNKVPNQELLINSRIWYHSPLHSTATVQCWPQLLSSFHCWNSSEEVVNDRSSDRNTCPSLPTVRSNLVMARNHLLHINNKLNERNIIWLSLSPKHWFFTTYRGVYNFTWPPPPQSQPQT